MWWDAENNLSQGVFDEMTSNFILWSYRSGGFRSWEGEQLRTHVFSNIHVGFRVCVCVFNNVDLTWFQASRCRTANQRKCSAVEKSGVDGRTNICSKVSRVISSVFALVIDKNKYDLTESTSFTRLLQSNVRDCFEIFLVNNNSSWKQKRQRC